MFHEHHARTWWAARRHAGQRDQCSPRFRPSSRAGSSRSLHVLVAPGRSTRSARCRPHRNETVLREFGVLGVLNWGPQNEFVLKVFCMCGPNLGVNFWTQKRVPPKRVLIQKNVERRVAFFVSSSGFSASCTRIFRRAHFQRCVQRRTHCLSRRPVLAKAFG